MSAGWEVTNDDVATVLNAHGITYTDERLDEIADMLDVDAIEDGVYFYTSIEAQTDSALCDIEDQLIEAGVITGDKKFENPEDDDEEDNEDDE